MQDEASPLHEVVRLVVASIVVVRLKGWSRSLRQAMNDPENGNYMRRPYPGIA